MQLKINNTMPEAKQTTDYNYSIEEYLRFEESSELKHEYKRGKILAMSGGTLNHSLIGTNTARTIGNALEAANKNCIVFNSDAKVFVEKAASFVYPDAMVVCGDIENHEIDRESVTNPVLIVEVLSKSTAGYDRGSKFRKYCSLPSFKEYVLIAQDEPVVEVLFRDKDFWRMTTVIGLDKSVTFDSLGITIELKEIYKNVQGLID